MLMSSSPPSLLFKIHLMIYKGTINNIYVQNNFHFNINMYEIFREFTELIPLNFKDIKKITGN